MKSNRLALAALATALVAGGASSARADLTYQGAVGLPLNPTAQIPLPGGVRLQGNYYDLGDANGPGVSVDSNLYGLYAAGRVGGTFELSGGIQQTRNRTTVLGATNSNNETGFALGGKYLFAREGDDEGVRLAVGGGYSDLDVAANNGRNFHAYVVGSKYLGAVSDERVPVTGHLGLRYDRFQFGTGVGKTRSNKASVFAGVEVPFTRTGDFSFVGELQSKNVSGGGTPYSASVRYRPRRQPFSASLGFQRQGVGGSGIFAHLGYSFDTGSAENEAEAPTPGQ
jgi:hypothetical protein